MTERRLTSVLAPDGEVYDGSILITEPMTDDEVYEAVLNAVDTTPLWAEDAIVWIADNHYQSLLIENCLAIMDDIDRHPSAQHIYRQEDTDE